MPGIGTTQGTHASDSDDDTVLKRGEDVAAAGIVQHGSALGLQADAAPAAAPLPLSGDNPPNLITASGPLAAAEDAANGTVVTTFSATDADDTVFTWSLTDSAGGRFSIDAAGQPTSPHRPTLTT